MEHLRNTHKAHEDAYAGLLASNDELKEWLGGRNTWDGMRMPLVGECHPVAKIACIDEVSRTQIPLERTSSTSICRECPTMVSNQTVGMSHASSPTVIEKCSHW